jgi:lambda family phage minor tail protein L
MPAPNSDLQRLYHSGIVALFTLDLTAIGGGVYRFCNYNQTSGANVSFGGVVYQAVPIVAEGFEINSTGQIPTPTLKVSNVFGVITGLIGQYDDLVGAKLTRRRTLTKYLDGQSAADSSAYFPDDIWYVERKVKEDKLSVEFQLASSLDLEGVQIPFRLMIQNTCVWQYRGDGCGYGGGPVADEFDNPTGDANLDKCGKRVTSCRLRFGQFGQLPFGGFPGLDRRAF